MRLSLENDFLEKYQDVEIGYLTAKVCITQADPFIQELKSNLKGILQNLEISPINFMMHPDIAIWRKIYADFQVNKQTYRSSIESLLRRVVAGKEIWNVCNVVDLYNCCSILSLLPMGGYDLQKISGDIKIRYARDGESFLGLNERDKIATKSNQAVYADNKRILCWLWNHKDSSETCIDTNTKSVIFFIDSFDHKRTDDALKLLFENLEKIQCIPGERGILNRTSPKANICL